MGERTYATWNEAVALGIMPALMNGLELHESIDDVWMLDKIADDLITTRRGRFVIEAEPEQFWEVVERHRR